MIECIGEAVRTARESAGMSLEELARRSDVPLALLELLEGGKRGVVTTQLADVAAALSLDSAELLRGSAVPRPAPSVFLRHRPAQDFDERDGLTLDDALDQGRALGGLRRQLGVLPLALQRDVFAMREPASHQPDAPARQGYQLAREVRQWLGIPVEPIGDLRALIEERFGIAVVVRGLKSVGATAVCVRCGQAGAIVLETTDPQRARNRLLGRVYLAHELCHALFDPSAGGLHIVIDVATDRKALAAEQRARAFAAELLLPREGVRQMSASVGIRDTGVATDLVERVRNRYGTPHPITVNHLCNQGMIALELRETLESIGSAFVTEPPATTLPAPGAPSLFVSELAAQAHELGHLTDGEARAILGLERLAPLPWDTEL